MQVRGVRKPAGILIVMLLVLPLVGHGVLAVEPGNDAFERTWSRTDKPVTDGEASRTWMWGPEAMTEVLEEEYVPAGSDDITSRTVQYFDKSRMEITFPDADPDEIWYVTNGLLVVELITGQVQVGDQEWVDRQPAEVNVAGDPDDPDGPTYATFTSLAYPEHTVESATGTTIAQRIDRMGNTAIDSTTAAHGVTAEQYVPDTGHNVASVFWDFMRAEGTIYEDDSFTTGDLFPDPFYATGFPITEAYWATVRVGTTPKNVLMQCFERRCLTYTPDNPPGWQVEAGNVGQHYHTWRYEQDNTLLPEEPEPEPLYQMAYIQRINNGESRTIFTMNSDGSDQQPIEDEFLPAPPER